MDSPHADSQEVLAREVPRSCPGWCSGGAGACSSPAATSPRRQKLLPGGRADSSRELQGRHTASRPPWEAVHPAFPWWAGWQVWRRHPFSC